MKKQLLVMASLATIMGLSFYSASHTQIDDRLRKDEDKLYLITVEGDIYHDDAETLKTYRNRALSQLGYLLPDGAFKVTQTYDTVMNGFAIKMNSRYEEALSNVKGVSSYMESHTYALPQAEATPFVAGDLGEATKEMRFANYSAETMGATAKDVQSATAGTSNGGKNVTIGIIDTGLYLNQIEGSAKRLADEATYDLNAAAFKDLADEDVKMTNADVLAKGFSASYYTHHNNKIFFAHDYTGGDADVDPTKNGSEHGTHVASLAAANGDDFQGIAPNAQVAVMKVFGDNDGGAATTDIIKAIDDAAKLGLDIINLSLGSDLGTDEDTIDSAIYTSTKAASEKGVIINFSAGNSGKSSFSSSATYSDWTPDIVETSILGGEAHFDETCNIVASSNPDRAFYSNILKVKQNGSEVENAVSYSDQAKPSSSQVNLTDRPLAGLIPEGASETTVDYVVIPGAGKSADYAGLDVKGKIAVVNRGTTTFVNKVKQAYNNGAKAMICINNNPSVTFNFNMAFDDYDPPIPVVFVFQNTKAYFGPAGSTGTLTIGTNTVQKASDGNTVSDFSSDGGEYNLDMGVTISAPGKEVIGAVDATYYNDNSDPNNPGYSLLHGYENMSGTSMASPNLTGAMALYLAEKNPTNGGSAAVAADDYLAEKKALSSKAMASADQLVDTTGTGTSASPRMQGAGRINVRKMLKANSYITTPNSDLGGFTNTVQSKVELKNSGSLFVEDGDFANAGEAYIEFSYTIHNDSDQARTYKPTVSVMIPSLRIQNTHDEYVEQSEESRAEIIGYDKDVDFDQNDLESYPYGVGQITASINNDSISVPADHLPTQSISVPANSTATANLKVRIDDLTLSKNWGDSKVDNFKGTLKEYFAKYFDKGFGNYVEGYLTLVEAGEDRDLDLTIPYLGFYGDYTKGAAVEDFDFEREERRLYTSDLVNNYMQNLGSDQYKKPNAYTGSTLSATKSSLTQSQLNQIGNMTTSAKPDGMTYLSVTGDEERPNYHIYAGAPGISEHLISVFFINRSLSSASWTIKDASNKTVKTGKIGDFFYYNGSFISSSDFQLCKSWLYPIGSADVLYGIHRGYADIDLSNVKEGDYTLEYSFTPLGTGKTQVKQYPLTVDKTAPSLSKASIVSKGDDQVLQLEAKGASDSISCNVSFTRKTDKIGDDLYSTNFYVLNDWIENDRIFLELTDYAHNKTTTIIKPSQIEFSVSSTFFTTKNNFSVTLLSSAGGMYTYEILITDLNDNEVTLKSGYSVNIQLATGLDPDALTVLVDSEDADFEYNAETGMLVVKMNKDSTTIMINSLPVTPGNGGNTSETVPPSSEPSTEPSTEQPSEPGEPSKKGCSGSVVLSSSMLGALALLTAGIALKKKREDK
ncbi:MAG: S8 family serine peptidase [Candidatus Enterosoma sp.]|nr:S8 family serine peptidase [Candidatus Enterosoma sp.]